MIPLCEQSIRSQLSTLGFTSPIDIHLLNSVDSTNRYLKEQVGEGVAVCCTETQTAGRGRFNRNWYSPSGENITMSLRLPLRSLPPYIATLGLVVSLSILTVLREFGFSDHLNIKWPNDILWQGNKLSGCLIELMSSHTNSMLIIGIGLNVNSKTNAHPNPGRPWCSLADIAHRAFDRNLIIGLLVEKLCRNFSRWLERGFTPFMSSWLEADGLFGQQISVTMGNENFYGIAQGITENGALIVQTTDGQIHYFSSGEATLHKP